MRSARLGDPRERLEKSEKASRLFGLSDDSVRAELLEIESEYAPVLLCCSHKDAWLAWELWAGSMLPDGFGHKDIGPVMTWMEWRYPAGRRLKIIEQLLAISTGATEELREDKNG